MRIAILTWSTRGEVQPYAALAHELERRGHRVVLGVNQNHTDWVARAGLRAAPLPLDFHALMRDETAQPWLTSGDMPGFVAWLAEREHEERDAIRDALIAACAGADAVVSGFLVSHRAAAIAQAKDIPFVRAFVYPAEPTTAYASPFMGNGMPPFVRGALRLRSHEVARAVFLRSQRADLDDMRRHLGLPMLEGTAEDDIVRRNVRTIHLFDELVLPRPEDWPAHSLVGGYCSLPYEMRERLGEARIAPDVHAWLDAGPPPIFFGFGSTPVLHPPEMLRLVDQVCHDLGARALVASGWSGFDETRTERTLVVGTLSYEEVFPRCRAAVHHGGAGTTAASLAAGLPTVVCSIFSDQPLWGHRVSRLGVGATMPIQRMNPRRLSDALRTVLADDVTARARALGAELRAADGLRRSADMILEGLN